MVKREKEYNRGTRCDSDAPRRKGMALIIILVLITAIVVVGLGFIIRGDTELLCGQNMELKADMDYLAESGLEHSRGLILNPQDVSGDYWPGTTGQQLVSGSNDYYDVAVNFNELYPFNYQITSSAYREGSMSAQESLTAELRLNPCIVYWQGGNQDIPSEVNITGDAYFGSSVKNYGKINGDVYSAGTVVNTGQIGGQTYQNVSQTPCNTPGISPSSFSSAYYIGSNSYPVGSFPERGPNDYNSLTLSPSGANPAGIYYCSSDLVVKSNVIVEGTLVVEGDLKIKDSGSLIVRSVKIFPPPALFPALIVSGKLKAEDANNTSVNITGYTQIGGDIDAQMCEIRIYGALYILGDGIKNAASVSVNGMPHKACLAIWSSGGNLNRWSPAAGAFYKSITR